MTWVGPATYNTIIWHVWRIAIALFLLTFWILDNSELMIKSMKKNKAKTHAVYAAISFWLFCYLSNNLGRYLNPVHSETQFYTCYKTDTLFHTWILLIIWYFTNIHIPKLKPKWWNSKEQERGKNVHWCQLVQQVRVYVFNSFPEWIYC